MNYIVNLDIIKHMCEPLRSDEIKQISTYVNVLHSEQVKAEKGNQKSTAAKQKQAAAQRARAAALKQMEDEVSSDYDGEDYYAAYEDKYDFM